MAKVNVIDRFFGTMQSCDTAVVRECLTDDATVWHSYDRIEMGVDDVIKAWEAMATAFDERCVTNVHRQQTANGYVQQHHFLVRTKDGTRKIWPVCVIVTLRDEKIARLEEYIDRAGWFDG